MATEEKFDLPKILERFVQTVDKFDKWSNKLKIFTQNELKSTDKLLQSLKLNLETETDGIKKRDSLKLMDDFTTNQKMLVADIIKNTILRVRGLYSVSRANSLKNPKRDPKYPNLNNLVRYLVAGANLYIYTLGIILSPKNNEIPAPKSLQQTQNIYTIRNISAIQDGFREWVNYVRFNNVTLDYILKTHKVERKDLLSIETQVQLGKENATSHVLSSVFEFLSL